MERIFINILVSHTIYLSNPTRERYIIRKINSINNPKSNKSNLYTQRTCGNRSPGSTNNVILKIFGWHQARFPQRMMAMMAIKLKIKE